MVAKKVSSFAPTKCDTATHAAGETKAACDEGVATPVGRAAGVRLVVGIEGQAAQPAKSAAATAAMTPVPFADADLSMARTTSSSVPVRTPNHESSSISVFAYSLSGPGREPTPTQNDGAAHAIRPMRTSGPPPDGADGVGGMTMGSGLHA